MKIYVLTREHNDYDQYGAYFVAAFKELPTAERLREKIFDDDGSAIDDATADQILRGGGRTDWKENVWWNMNEVTIA